MHHGRVSVFDHAGLFDPALDVGTVTNGGGDLEMFFRVLKAGHTLIYEPRAFVWHKHRTGGAALRYQRYAHSKGHVAYRLTTLLRDGDWRALLQLAVRLPRIRLGQIKARLAGRSPYPLSLLLVETAGNLAGPWSLWRSRRRVAREGLFDNATTAREIGVRVGRRHRQRSKGRHRLGARGPGTSGRGRSGAPPNGCAPAGRWCGERRSHFPGRRSQWPGDPSDPSGTAAPGPQRLNAA